jgi:hypothetical protein
MVCVIWFDNVPDRTNAVHEGEVGEHANMSTRKWQPGLGCRQDRNATSRIFAGTTAPRASQEVACETGSKRSDCDAWK